MVYNEFKGKQLSALGMGCMRLPTKGENKEIDMDSSRKLIAYAMERGINYYDTAWGYHGGNSELAMGEILSEYPRDSFYLASKFPGYDLNNMGKVEEIFEKQLEKCRVEYFDFYMFHNVCELNIDEYLNEKNRIFEYLCEQKKNGRIKHLGFSAHGSLATLERFLKAYGSEMEFCQLQINWLDWNFQNAKAKVEMMNEWNIPVWVMEPVRGGRLCKLDEKYEDRLKAVAPDRSLPEWAFRFIQSIPEVKVTLSGMSNFEQLKENIDTYETNTPLSKEEFDLLLSIAREMTSVGTLPCTSCRYCTDHCPQEINIPWLIELYNEQIYSNGGFIAPMALRALPEDKRPSGCIGCRSCEAVCPQNIKISEMMTDFSSRLKY
ncbi:MAG: oxidoreductase [Ruminococcaceae bacterium]|nr:oxidoreductase [Oscillospiraceae bacterium]